MKEGETCPRCERRTLVRLPFIDRKTRRLFYAVVCEDERKCRYPRAQRKVTS